MSIFAQGIIITILKDVCYDHPKKTKLISASY